MLGDRQAFPAEQPVHERFVERELDRDRVVERDELFADACPPAAGAELEKPVAELVELRPDLRGSFRPDPPVDAAPPRPELRQARVLVTQAPGAAGPDRAGELGPGPEACQSRHRTFPGAGGGSWIAAGRRASSSSARASSGKSVRSNPKSVAR